MDVTFDFTSKAGPVDHITVTSCPAELHQQLQDAAAGRDSGSVFQFSASANGDPERILLFRSSRISNVQVAA